MKKLRLLLALVAMGAGTLTLSSCGNSESKAATLTGAYLSPTVLKYMNMRPTYNYYMTYFTFQELETYDDNTYILTVSSSMFSGLVLPDEGNDATGNERENFIQKYYGTCTSAVDELDSDTLNITLAKPTRFVNVYDSTTYFDTANWTEKMSQDGGTKAEGSETVTPISAADYLAQFAFKETVFSVSKVNYSFTYTTLTVE